jgi:hypothetical protein
MIIGNTKPGHANSCHSRAYYHCDASAGLGRKDLRRAEFRYNCNGFTAVGVIMGDSDDDDEQLENYLRKKDGIYC